MRSTLPLDWDLNLLTPIEDNGGGNSVPDGGSTLALLGAGLSVVEGFRRKSDAFRSQRRFDHHFLTRNRGVMQVSSFSISW